VKNVAFVMRASRNWEIDAEIIKSND